MLAELAEARKNHGGIGDKCDYSRYLHSLGGEAEAEEMDKKSSLVVFRNLTVDAGNQTHLAALFEVKVYPTIKL